jgi:hypothetical protein
MAPEPRSLSALIDRIEAIREELLTVQRSLEHIEVPNTRRRSEQDTEKDDRADQRR